MDNRILQHVEKMAVRYENEQKPLPQVKSSRMGTSVGVGGGGYKLWRVKSIRASTYEAYYTCYTVTIDAGDFYTGNTDPIDSTAVEEIVLCIPERGFTTEPMLIAGDLLYGWTTLNDEGKPVNMAWPDPTRAVRWAQTNGAAGASLTLSVKLLTDAGAETGDAFNAVFKSVDGSTAANLCLPLVGDDKWVQVSKIAGVWYIINPTLTAKGSSSSTVNSGDLTASDTITGAVLSSIGEW